MKTLNANECESKSLGQRSIFDLPVPQELSIEVFIDHLRLGINGLCVAGSILVKLLEKDNHVFSKIMDKHPWVTMDCLMTLLNIGKRRLHPEVLLQSARVQKSLLELPYEKQEEILKNAHKISKLKEEASGEMRKIRLGSRKPEIIPKRSDWLKPVRVSEPDEFKSNTKEHGSFCIIFKDGLVHEAFKRAKGAIDCQRIRLMPDPSKPGTLVANVEFYEFNK